MPALILPWDDASIDFAAPAGEAALVPADSVSWRIFKNPVALFVGGVAAVLLEFADPAVRTGVWEHSSFRRDPVHRLRRTGMAAMVTVYGAKSVAEPMIAGVARLHEKVRGVTPDGQSYAANDVELLTWVHATAGYGFAEAYASYVQALSDAEHGLRAWQRPLVKMVGGLADRVVLRSSPAAQSCVRLGLPADWLYR